MIRIMYSVLAVFLTLATSTPSARGQPAAGVSATAESLFQEGKMLMDEQRYAEACQKFEGSFALEAALGTLLNLANCHELEGKTATAWAEFLRAGAMARAESQDAREELARERARALEPRLVRLKIVVPEAVIVPGLHIQRDRVPVEPAAWGSAIPVDPGTHQIMAFADGKRPASAEVECTIEGATVEFTLAPLKDKKVVVSEAPPPVATLRAPTAASEPSTPPPAADTQTGSDQRTFGLVVGAVGAAGLAAAGVFGSLAAGRWDEAKEEGCADGICPTRAGQLASDDANDLATFGTVSLAGGGALLATGVILYLTAPSSSSASSKADTLPLGLNLDPLTKSASVRLGGAF